MSQPQLTRAHRILIGVVVAGAAIIAGIGFAGSYAAVRELAEKKGFGTFSLVFPIGIDAGICVLLALDLLLTWMRIPFPLLRQAAWLLTAGTILFNGAASWGDPLGVGMHAVIPLLFVVSVEAARHAVGRIADITADKHMEGVRLTRWLLSPLPTFRLWRRMKIWELRSYDQVIKLEQDRLIYQARLQARFGRTWRREAPVESLMPLRLAKYGVPLVETAPAGLAAAGIDPVLLPSPPQLVGSHKDLMRPAEHSGYGAAELDFQRADQAAPLAAVEQPINHESPWFTTQHLGQEAYQGTYDPQDVEGLEPTPVTIPTRPGHSRLLGNGPVCHPRAAEPQLAPQQPLSGESASALIAPDDREDSESEAQAEPLPVPEPGAEARADASPEDEPVPAQAEPRGRDRTPQPPRGSDEPLTLTAPDRYYLAWESYAEEHRKEPTAAQLSEHLARKGILSKNGTAIPAGSLRRYLLEFRIYTVWAEQRGTGSDPDLPLLVEELARRGVTGQYKRRLEVDDVDKFLPDFRRRHRVVSLDLSDAAP